MAQHLLKHPDIVSIRIKTDPEALAAADTLRHLLRKERALIHSAQKLGLLARNKSEMTVLIGKAQLDCSISPLKQAAWLSNPADKNRSDLDTGRVLDCASTVFAGSDQNFANFSKLVGAELPLVLSLIGQYLRKCIPHPNATEGHFWNISAPLSSYRGKAPSVSHTLCCLSVGWVETLVILKRVGAGEIHGFLQVNGTELFGDVNPDVAFLQLKRQHPGVRITPAEYRDSGPDNWNIYFSNLHVLARLLADPRVVRAAATTALLLMRVRRAPSTRQQTHCPRTVTAAWDQLNRDSE